ncbi:hypothetical protein ACQJBY_073495 [Aegilops geniculata]
MACCAFVSVQLSVEKTVWLSMRWTRWEPRPNHSTAVQYLSQMIQTLSSPNRTTNAIVKKMSYITVEKRDKDSPPLFGGRQTWEQREDSFKLNATMKSKIIPMLNPDLDVSSLNIKNAEKPV